MQVILMITLASQMLLPSTYSQTEPMNTTYMKFPPGAREYCINFIYFQYMLYMYFKYIFLLILRLFSVFTSNNLHCKFLRNVW